jgi:hypothetical protein
MCGLQLCPGDWHAFAQASSFLAGANTCCGADWSFQKAIATVSMCDLSFYERCGLNSLLAY